MADDAEHLTDQSTTSPDELAAPGAVGDRSDDAELARPEPSAPRPETSEADQYLIVAKVLRAHSTQGEVACEIVTEFPERFKSTKRVFLTPASLKSRLEPQDGATPTPYAVKGARLVQHRGHAEVVISLDTVGDRDAADQLRGYLVQVPEREAWKLPRGRFYWHQILGLRVVTTNGDEVGTVTDILETGANDVYVVKRGGAERLIPAIKQVVLKIAPERGEMVVELLPGM